MDAIWTWLFALALLTGDSTKLPTDFDKVREAFPALRQPMTRLALEMQILDPRETRFVLEKTGEFETDLRMMQARAKALRSAPRLVEAERFPPRPQVNELLATNRERRKALEEIKPKDDAEATAIRSQIAELDRLYQLWDAARDARCEYYYVTVRRQALARLKGMLGEADFKAAKLPPAVP